MFNSPNYAKKTATKPPPLSDSTAEIVAMVVAGVVAPVYEPLMAASDLVLTTDGDLLIAKSATAPLELV